MKEVVDWVVANIGPNVVKYTTDSGRAAAAVRVRRGRRRRRSGTASPGSSTSTATTDSRAARARRRSIPANGYLWIPKDAPHPVLAQIFIELAAWPRTSSSRMPGRSTTASGASSAEGFLGPGLRQDQVPDWFKADYSTYYPTPRPDQVGLQDGRLGGLQRQRRRSSIGLLRPAARPVGQLKRWTRLARPTAGEPFTVHRWRSWSAERLSLPTAGARARSCRRRERQRPTDRVSPCSSRRRCSPSAFLYYPLRVHRPDELHRRAARTCRPTGPVYTLDNYRLIVRALPAQPASSRVQLAFLATRRRPGLRLPVRLHPRPPRPVPRRRPRR